MPVIIKLCAALVVPILTGFALLLCFPQPTVRPKRSLTAALSYGLGIGILAQWMLVLGVARVPYTVATMAWPLVIFSLGICCQRKHNVRFWITSRDKDVLRKEDALGPSRVSLTRKIIYVGLGVFILYSMVFVFWRAFNVPVVEWDAVSTAAYKAKVFFHEKSLYKPALLPKASYPLQTSFLMAWTAFNLGYWDEILVKLFFPVSFLAFLVIQYHFVASAAPKAWAWGSIALLLTANFVTYHATIEYRDLTVSFFNCSAILLLFMWGRRKELAFLLLAGFYSGFTTFMKLEGTGYWFIHLLVFFIILSQDLRSVRPRLLRSIAAFVVPSAGICLFYYLYKAAMGITAAEGRDHVEMISGLGARAGTIIYEFSRNLFLTGNWGMIWFLLGVSFLKFPEFRRRREVSGLLLSLALYFVLYFCVALLSPNFVSLAGKESPTVLSRIILHFFPLAAISVILIHAPQKKYGTAPDC